MLGIIYAQGQTLILPIGILDFATYNIHIYSTKIDLNMTDILTQHFSFWTVYNIQFI
jgi:hypothetical protein